MRRLKTIPDVRRFLAKVILDLERGKIEPQKAGRLGYLSNILVKTLEVQHQQQKVETLSERLDEMEDNVSE